MIIDVDLTGAPTAIELLQPEDCARFHVEARGGESEALAAALSAADVVITHYASYAMRRIGRAR